jgi:hypothetical protein
MRCYEGYLEGYGGWDSFLGGARYSWLRLRKEDGTVENIPHIVAYPNVQAQIDYILETGEEPEQVRVKLYTKGGLYIYALDNCGVLYTDYPMLNNVWRFSMLKTFGFLAISFFLFFTGDSDMAVGGLIFLLIGIILFIANIGGTVMIWPSSRAGRLKSTTEPYRAPRQAA